MLRTAIPSLLICASGCVTEGPPERRTVRPMQEQPEGVVVDRVVPAIDKLADDTDRNGYYDTFRVAIFLFGSGYTQSIQAQGSFECRLIDQPSGKEIVKWTLGEAALKDAWGMSGVMPGYNFLLNMNDVGSDRVAYKEALFSCVFRPLSGPPIESRSRLVVMIGPLR